MRYDSLYLSPHLDDVAISCAGRILKERAGGKRVWVVSIFTAGAPDEARRKEEDRRAMARLGVDFEWLDLPDAPWRNPFYRSFRSIVFGEHPNDRGFLSGRVRPAVEKLVRRAAPSRIYVPLAVGTHIDHRLTFEAGRSLGGVVFYEDRPYAFLEGSVRMRLAELDARVARPPRRTSPERLRSSLDRTAYVRAYLGRRERGPCVSAFLRRLRQSASWEGRGDGLALRSEWVRCDRRGLGRVRAAVNEYTSQIEDLLGEDSLMWIGSAERYWILLDKGDRREYM